MQVTRLELKNWRNFRSVDIALTERMFLLGPNAAGKSNLLDVFRFLRDIVKPGGGLQYALTRRLGLSKVRCLSARRNPEVEIAIEVRENGSGPVWKYHCGITQQVRGLRLPILKSEKVWLDGKCLLDRPNKDDQADELRLSQTHLEQINANAPFRDLARFFEQFRYLHLVPQLVRNPEAFQGPGLPDDPFGRNFMEAVAKSPQKTRDARLLRIERALQLVVPHLKKLTLAKDEIGIPHLEAVYDHWRGYGARQREDQFSDGTLRLIGLFWSLFEGDSLLLLEEPELSLHSEIVRQLPPMIAQLQRKRRRQIIISTHSAELLSDPGIGGEEVVLLKPGLEGTTAQVVNTIEGLRQKLQAGLSVADVVIPETTPFVGARQLSLALESA